MRLAPLLLALTAAPAARGAPAGRTQHSLAHLDELDADVHALETVLLERGGDEMAPTKIGLLSKKLHGRIEALKTELREGVPALVDSIEAAKSEATSGKRVTLDFITRCRPTGTLECLENALVDARRLSSQRAFSWNGALYEKWLRSASGPRPGLHDEVKEQLIKAMEKYKEEQSKGAFFRSELLADCSRREVVPAIQAAIDHVDRYTTLKNRIKTLEFSAIRVDAVQGWGEEAEAVQFHLAARTLDADFKRP